MAKKGLVLGIDPVQAQCAEVSLARGFIRHYQVASELKVSIQLDSTQFERCMCEELYN